MKAGCPIFILLKKLLAIFTLSVYLLSTTELSELLKLPLLIEHYHEHKCSAPDLSFKDFLVLHYNNHLEGHAHNDDYEKDMQLPFITHSGFMGIAVVVPKMVSLADSHSGDESDKPVVVNDPFAQRLMVSQIWQPPRFA